MNGFGLTLLALALSLEIFAIAVCKGVSMRRLDLRHTSFFLLSFVPVQVLMMALGCFAGTKAALRVAPFAGWVTLLIFAVVGANMINEGRKDFSRGVLPYGKDNVVEMLILSMASGVNAFAVGAAVSILSAGMAVALILVALTTLVMSVLGIAAGHLFGSQYSGGVVITGGGITIAAGVFLSLYRILFAGSV